jgi:hypothetical protein
MSSGELLLMGLLNFIYEINNHKSRRKIWHLVKNLEIHIFRLEVLILFSQIIAIITGQNMIRKDDKIGKHYLV